MFIVMQFFYDGAVWMVFFRRPHVDVLVQLILSELGKKINTKNTCKCNRSTVFGGVIHGFMRMSYNPNHGMYIKLFNDKETVKEAVGGPRREFIWLLQVPHVIIQVPMPTCSAYGCSSQNYAFRTQIWTLA